MRQYLVRLSAPIAGGTADSHYSVLMIIPILSAAYRFSLAVLSLSPAVTIVLTFFGSLAFF
ncbi:MAG: hypothetical protein IPO41_14635 [Acidobacteria bacterium]|nr:hypothetical protein [Acidobacteriota bacterium]